MQVKERYEQILKNSENPNLKVAIENFDKASSHPDTNDIRKVKKWIRELILNKK